MDNESSGALELVRCTESGCDNSALLILANGESGRAWCLGHAYVAECPSGCGASVWNCPIAGCGDCQGINEDANDAILEIWTIENRVFGFVG